MHSNIFPKRPLCCIALLALMLLFAPILPAIGGEADGLRPGTREYLKAKRMCAICEDLGRLDTGPRHPRKGGFSNKKLEDDQMRYRVDFNEFFDVNKCKEEAIKDLCARYRSVANKGKKKDR
jgi:hypothetical protein